MTSGRAGDQAGNFDPGKSLTEESSPAPNLSELPSWLQNFAATTSDTPSAAPTIPASSPVHAQQPQHQAGDSVMPGWFDSPASEPPPPTPSALIDASSIGGANYFSEDDLPEWLRSLSSPPSADNSGWAGSVAAVAPAAEDSINESNRSDIVSGNRSGNATTAVPTVARIWITDQDNTKTSPAASVFAEVAQVADLRPDVLVSESPSAVGVRADQPVTSKPATAVVKTTGSANTWSWTFRLVVLMMILLAMIALVYVNLAV